MMPAPRLPVILEAGQLATAFEQGSHLLIVDLSPPAVHARHRLPGARRLDVRALIEDRPPVLGLLPDPMRLADTFAALGVSAESHIVAYDDEHNIKACRLLWTLDVIGHRRFSLLNGGQATWADLNLPAVPASPAGDRGTGVKCRYQTTHLADKAYILAHLNDPDVVILDCRSPEEYAGRETRAARGGHIPGAVNIEWRRAVDPTHPLRLRPAAELRDLYAAAGITPDKEIIVHCHSNQRSSHSYIVLKSLGYKWLKAYPGSWSDWGNDPQTPIEV